MKLSLNHVCIKTTDLAATEDFYLNKLGLEKAFNFFRKGKLFGFYLKISEETFLEIFEDLEVQPAHTSLAHLALLTDDIDGWMERLNQNGIKTTPKKTGSTNTYQIWFKDPNGVNIEIQQYTAESTQLTGKDTHVTW